VSRHIRLLLCIIVGSHPLSRDILDGFALQRRTLCIAAARVTYGTQRPRSNRGVN